MEDKVSTYLVPEGISGEPGVRYHGQLGMLTRRMAEAGVNIEVLYSDHDHQLILVVDDVERGREVSRAWARETGI